jgi:hypothetical protein
MRLDERTSFGLGNSSPRRSTSTPRESVRMRLRCVCSWRMRASRWASWSFKTLVCSRSPAVPRSRLHGRARLRALAGVGWPAPRPHHHHPRHRTPARKTRHSHDSRSAACLLGGIGETVQDQDEQNHGDARPTMMSPAVVGSDLLRHQIPAPMKQNVTALATQRPRWVSRLFVQQSLRRYSNSPQSAGCPIICQRYL